MAEESATKKHSVLVIGCGSIGERHLRCFLASGRVVAGVCDTHEQLLAQVSARHGVEGWPSLDAALAARRHDAWVICTPAHTHLRIALRGLQNGAHLLIEKPLAVDLDGVEEVRAAMRSGASHVAVAYVYHAMPWLRGARSAILRGEIGTVLHISVVAGQHFPTFRPAYRTIYYSRHETGGGAIQDALTHLANAVEWLAGPTTRVFCDAAHQALADVEVEDTVNISARQGDILTSYAMNQFQAPNEAEIRIHGDRGSIAVQAHRQRWGLLLAGEKDWMWNDCGPLERDDLFVLQAREFLDGIEGGESALATFEEAVQTLKFNRAALQSARSGSPVEIS